MNGKMIVTMVIGIIVAIAAGGIVGTYLLPARNETVRPIVPAVVQPTSYVPLSPGLSPRIFPTTVPLPYTVKKIDDQYIVVDSENGGEMYEPKDPSHLTVFKMKNGQRLPATFNDVKVGQKVNLTIIIPGKQAEMVIEE